MAQTKARAWIPARKSRWVVGGVMTTFQLEQAIAPAPGEMVRTEMNRLAAALAEVGITKYSTRIWVDGEFLKMRLEEARPEQYPASTPTGRTATRPAIQTYPYPPRRAGGRSY